jgi:recombination protein RecA
MSKEKDKAIRDAMRVIDKQFGTGSIMRMGDGQVAQVDVIPTGSLALDLALGVGGLPRGRVVEIYGPESSGKTTLTLHAIAEAQCKGGVCAFIDAEHALDTTYAASSSTTCSSPSLTAASRPSRSATPSPAPAPSI